MPHRPFIILVALFFAICLPLIYVWRKRRAASSMAGWLAERFLERPCPVQGEVVIPSGGRVKFNEAYNDRLGSGFALLLGTWSRGTILSQGAAVPIYNRVAGLYKEGPDVAWLDSIRTHRGVIAATAVEGGSAVIWEGLPSRDSVLAHIQAASSSVPKIQSTAVPPEGQVQQPPPPVNPVDVEPSAQTANTVATPLATQPEAATQPKLPGALNPRDAYFLGYLPSVAGKILVNDDLIDEMEAHAGGDAKLTHACDFSRKANKISEGDMRRAYDDLAKYGKELSFEVPPLPPGKGYEQWARKMLDAGRAATKSESAAFEAGAAAGDVQLGMWIARNLIYIRTSAPANAFLKNQADQIAANLDAAAARLNAALDKLGKRSSGEISQVRALLGKRPAISSLVNAGGVQKQFDSDTAMQKQLQALGQSLDRPVEARVTGPPTAQEEKLLQEIIASPEDDAPRTCFAKLAALRKDPRAELIEWQIALRDMRRTGPMTLHESKALRTAAQIVQSHPEWSDPVLRLGAQVASFRRGFVDEISIDAARFLVAAPAFYKIAPILHVHFTGAKGKFAELVACPHLARLLSIDLRENGLTDDEVEVLAESPNLARLRWLSLTLNKITSRGVEALAASTCLGSLRYVELALNPCDDPTPRFVETEGMGSFWESTPAGIALEKKLGRKIQWLHQDFSRWPADIEAV